MQREIPLYTLDGVKDAEVSTHYIYTEDKLRLSALRFQRGEAGEAILVIHGLTTSSDMFIMPEHYNLVQFLLDSGFTDVWCLDFRMSNRYSYNLFPHRSVLENVTEGPIHVLKMPRAEAEDRATRLLDRVGLRDRLSARPRELSGGQQQRVAIARALAMEPRAMLFDEPTSALDPRMTAEVLAVMADLARDGLTMLVVTHAMRFARRLATTVHVLGDGLIVESGPPEQVFDAPRTEATRRLLAEVEAA